MLLAFTNIKRALTLFLNLPENILVGKVLSYGKVKRSYWIKYTTVKGLIVKTCCTFVSFKWLAIAFVELRKSGAQSVELYKLNDNTFHAYGKQIYVVKLDKLKGSSCTCEDFKLQFTTFGRGCCKHVYKALNVLGFDSIQEYLKK
jgi:SWIM zinc finger